jgi:hypothetical protein|tara:strand:+ start:799 stop:1017 length:219 start_codon:yes stop_codon:yes gene_type:complete
MAKKRKYDLQYLYDSYKKNFKKLDFERAEYYNDLSLKLHRIDLRDRFHKKEQSKEKNLGMYGLGKVKKIKYG